MKRQMLLMSLLAAVLSLATDANAAHSSLDVDIRIGAFYRPLASHGEWIEVDPGVVVWRPIRVRAGWRPYMEGRWMWTDYGWYWVSAEPFGWAVYHYGRWHYDDFYGWVWMPDNEWGPAWVEWRYNDDYIGWAPLPPYATFHISFGIRFTRGWNAPYDYWCFVPYRRFGSVIRYRDYAQPTYVRRLIGTTRSGGGYDMDRDRVVNRGVDRSFVERQSGVRIERTEIRQATDRSERLRSGTIESYRPGREDFDRAEQPRNIRRGDRRLNIEMDRIDRSSSSDIPTPRTRDSQTVPNDRRDAQRQQEIDRSKNERTSPAPGRTQEERARPAPSRSRQPEVKPNPTQRNRPAAKSSPMPQRSSAPPEGRSKRRG